MNIPKIALKATSKPCYCSLKVEKDEIPHVSLLQNIYCSAEVMGSKLQAELYIQLLSLLFSQEAKMAVSPLKPKIIRHARSISLLSRPHPLIPEFDEHLRRLRTSEATSLSSSVSHYLGGLKDLYACVDNLILLPLTQQILTLHICEKWVDEIMDGSLRLLDVCGTAKNGFSTEVEEYLTSRKKVKKTIHKVLRNRKGMENKCSFSPLTKQPETISIVSMLREVETVTLKVLESLLSSIAREAAQSKPSGWALVSNLMGHKHIACEETTTDLGELVKVDATLSILIGHKSKSLNPMHIDEVQNKLGKLETSIQDLEEGLEFLSRHLIKARVSLLNILSH